MAPNPKSFYWYDLETTGLQTRWDRITQFAGQRTDLELNPIGKPYITYIKLPDHVVPDPVASLITAITPQRLEADGIREWEAIKEIHQHLIKPGTCAIGYNNIAFDDEFIRFALYRNLLPPYGREFRRGNSRADLYTIVRAAAAMRPTNIQWPRDKEGTIQSSLKALAEANGIDPKSAHDAHADVMMSIELARVIKRTEPRLWTYVLAHQSKQAIRDILGDDSRFYLHVSSSYGAKRSFAAPVKVLAPHPDIDTRVLLADLTADLRMLESATPQELREARFLTQDEAEASGKSRLSITEIATNKCPVIIGVDKLTNDTAARLHVNIGILEHNLEFLNRLESRPFQQRMEEMMRLSSPGSSPTTDPAEMLYDGFISNADARLCEEIHRAIELNQKWPKLQTQDARIKALANRLRLELRPDEVPEQENRHRRYVQQSLQRETIGIAARRAQIVQLRTGQLDAGQAVILDAVSDYIEKIAVQYDV